MASSANSAARDKLAQPRFGDEIEQVRAFSPFTQRALHAVDEASIYPASERRSENVELDAPAHGWEDEGALRERAATAPADLVPPVGRAGSATGRGARRV